MSDRPTHVIADPGDRRSVCGVKDPLPVVWRRHVPMHVKGHGMTVCADCQTALDALPNDESETPS